MSDEQWLIKDKISVRPEPNGTFDELLMYHDGECTVHAEMMDKNKLWIGFYPPGDGERRVCMWITATRGKLEIHAAED